MNKTPERCDELAVRAIEYGNISYVDGFKVAYCMKNESLCNFIWQSSRVFVCIIAVWLLRMKLKPNFIPISPVFPSPPPPSDGWFDCMSMHSACRSSLLFSFAFVRFLVAYMHSHPCHTTNCNFYWIYSKYTKCTIYHEIALTQRWGCMEIIIIMA